MKKSNFLQTCFQGVIFVIPIGILLFLFSRALKTFEKIVGPLAEKMGMAKVLGGLTFLVLAIICFVILSYLVGLIAKISYLRSIRTWASNIVLKMFPTLENIKALATDKLDIDAPNAWESVLLKDGEGWSPAYITSHNNEQLTFFIPSPPKGETGRITIRDKKTAEYKPIHVSELLHGLKQYGKTFSADEKKK